ncbi:hypothetical protein DFJ63DRAFT_334709 [Scheffersomyces coipomensis]|uniref:uncharacterized protein n=1 Tax=Scheffersomyces coipomensis TaxID=1788519 RepID=UPI00315D5FE1
MTDIPLNLEVEPSAFQPFPSTNSGDDNGDDTSYRSVKINDKNVIIGNRKRSNSQSQANTTPTPISATSNTTTNNNNNNNNNGSSNTTNQSKSSSVATSTSIVNGTSSSATSILSTTNRQHTLQPKRRTQLQHYVTLVPLNDTFIKKHLPVSIFPETTKLGRPTGTKHKPDVTNGYFESRVLSRNHAQIYIDPSNGKLMLQDLHSSNGTYVNEMKLADDPVEINIGDVVCLGFNVQTESTHKQISLRVDNINIIPNTSSNTTSKTDSTFQILQDDSSIEFKHLSFIEDIYRQIKAKEEQEEQQQQKYSQKNIQKPKDLDDLSFDSALFGDINPDLEDNLLGLYSGANSGIFNNSQITNSNTFEGIINQLVINLSKVKQQNNNLVSISQFLTNYQENLSTINSKYLDKQFEIRTSDITQELSQQKLNTIKLNDQLKSVEKELNVNKDIYSSKLKTSKREYEDLNKKYDKLREKFDDLQTQLELEKKKSAILMTQSPSKDSHEYADASNELLIDEFDDLDDDSIISNSYHKKETNTRKRQKSNADSASLNHNHNITNGSDNKEVYINGNETVSSSSSSESRKNALLSPNTPNNHNNNHNHNNNARQAIARNDMVDLTPPISDNEDNDPDIEEIRQSTSSESDDLKDEEIQSSISTLNGVFHDTLEPILDDEDTFNNTDSKQQQGLDGKVWIPMVVILFTACLTAFYTQQEPNVVSNYIYNSLNS